MASENEPAKLLLPYLQRADELQKHEPLVSYYCRLYAMERGLKIPNNQRTKTTNSLLISLMNQLEKDKKSLTLGPDDHLHLEGFALNVFGKADKQDRAGRADLSTAKTFYAASIFFEILNQFGDLAPDLEQKQKYAVWKAADIRKAIKDGRKPVPGPPGGEEELTRSSSSLSGSYDPEGSQPGQDINPGFGHEPPPSQSPHYEDEMRRLPSTKVAPSSQSPHFEDEMRRLPSMKSAPPPSSYPNDYPTQDYPSSHSIPPPSENPTYSQPPYHHQPSYQQEPPVPPQTQHLPPQNNSYPSQEIPPSFSYPNFQTYPSFSESSLPAVPSHQPSFYQGPDSSSYSQQPPPPPAQSYQSMPDHNVSHGNGFVQGSSPTPAQSFNYDPNYQPPAEKIAEAHKAARFAVGALAFDDVTVAVDFLKKSLELLTNPSAGE